MIIINILLEAEAEVMVEDHGGVILVVGTKVVLHMTIVNLIMFRLGIEVVNPEEVIVVALAAALLTAVTIPREMTLL